MLPFSFRGFGKVLRLSLGVPIFRPCIRRLHALDQQLIDAARQHNHTQALQLFKHMQYINFAPSPKIFPQVVKCVGASLSGLFACTRWLADICRAGIVMQVEGYTALISAAAQHEQHDLVQNLLDDMIARGVQPNQVTFHGIIVAYARRGDARYLHWMQRLYDIGLTPSAETFNELIYLASVAKDVALCRYWGQQMRGCGFSPNRRSFLHLISCSDAVDCPAVLEEMRESGYAINIVPYMAVLLVYEQAGLPYSALELWAQMRDDGVLRTFGSYGRFVRAVGSAGDVAQCYSILQDYEDQFGNFDRPGRDPIASLVNVCGKHSTLDECFRVLDIALSKGGSLDVAVIAALAGAFARRGDSLRCLELVALMQEYDMQPDSFLCSAMVEVFWRVKDAAQCVHWWEKLTTMPVVHAGELPYGPILCALAEAGDHRSCATIMQEFAKLKRKLPSDRKRELTVLLQSRPYLLALLEAI